MTQRFAWLLAGLAAWGFTSTASAQQVDGAALYREHCRTCHGATGVPPQRAIKEYKDIRKLSDADFQAARSDDSLAVSIAEGIGKDMKPFKGKLTKEQIQAVVQYVRTLVKPKPPPGDRLPSPALGGAADGRRAR